MIEDPLYREVCANIRVTDDISFKLLGFVPLVSGAGIVVVLIQSSVQWSPAIYLISMLGAGVTFGLFRWELKNILTCNWLIRYAEALEFHAIHGDKVLGPVGVGQFYRRPTAPGLFPELRSKDSTSAARGFGKTEAEKLVYSLVILSWLILPGIARLSASSNSTSRHWEGVLTVIYILMASLIAVLTLCAVCAKVTNRPPLVRTKAEVAVKRLLSDEERQRLLPGGQHE